MPDPTVRFREGILADRFIFDAAPFPSCHAATLVETTAGRLLAAFFGGTREGAADVRIWTARFDGAAWSPPEAVADGVHPDGTSLPCWNPVLFRPAGGREITLFYKVGPSPSKWWGMVKRSADGGRTWGDAQRLPEGILGPAKNKPVQLAGGRIVSPCSVEHQGAWRAYFEISDDAGQSWRATPPVEQPTEIPKANQPTILVHSDRDLHAICRTTVGRLAETWSSDAGATWSPLRLIDLPNCNSGIDAVTLASGAHLLVYNHSNLEKVRYPLDVAQSRDGKTWRAAAVLEDQPPGQYSYPVIIESSDGLAHVAYTFKRRSIKHVMIDPSKLRTADISAFACPPPGSPTHRADEFQ